MRAAVVQRHGGPEVIAVIGRPAPVPAPGQVLVRVRATGVNFSDVVSRRGGYPGGPRPPYVPGTEVAGEVVSVGDGVSGLRPGSRVTARVRCGGHAELVAVEASLTFALPDAFGFEEGAALVVAGLTAQHALIRLANLQEGERVLVHAAGGAVGLACVQLARHLGATVLATAGTEEKRALALREGAHRAIDSRAADFADVARHAAPEGAVDVVVDSVGGETYRQSWPLLAPMGRYVLTNVSAAHDPSVATATDALRVHSAMKAIHPASLIDANRGVFGFNLASLPVAYLKRGVSNVMDLYGRGALRPVVGRVLPLEGVAEAHRLLEQRRAAGKLVVTPD